MITEPVQGIDTAVVVPCYNEAERLPAQEFIAFCARTPWVAFVFVNDGSTDGTLDVLRDVERQLQGRVEVVDQQPNQGKAAAVRAGVLWALGRPFRYVGYWDADLATPLDEIPRFRLALTQDHGLEIVLGSRVRMLGREIARSPVRHYLGRVFATAASMTLGLPVYDTQCGAKLFRVSEQTSALFHEPFCTGWIFDVEILARLVAAQSDPSAATRMVRELPLDRWTDVAGSRVRPGDFFKATLELERIRRRYLRGIHVNRSPDDDAKQPPR